jgi:hypothetical protein
MKKIVILAVVLTAACTGLYAQSQNLRDNADYKEGMRYQSLARQAYEEGDYDKSVEYSAAAQERFQKAKDYADKMALRYTATNLKNRVADRLHYAEYIHAQEYYAQEYTAAQTVCAAANEAYSAEEYPASIKGYQAALDLLKDIAPVVPKPSAELAKAEELRAIISEYGFDALRPTETQRGETAYEKGKELIGTDNSQAKLMLNEAIRHYQTAIDESVAALAAKRRTQLAEAKKRADEVNAQVFAPDPYNEAQQKQRSAESNLFAGDWNQAWADSQDALAAYNASYEAALASGNIKPEYYTVRLIPGRRDCLWRIAGYDFVYGDPWKWRLLYNENKDLLPNPANPRLIEPGTRLRIPSLEGEKRAGDYQPK